MAKFETEGFDELDEALEGALQVEAQCPICNKAIVLDLTLEDRKVICPHCNSEIEY